MLGLNHTDPESSCEGEMCISRWWASDCSLSLGVIDYEEDLVPQSPCDFFCC